MENIDIGQGDNTDVPLIPYREFTDKKVLEEGAHCIIYSARHPTFGRCCLRIFSKYFLVRGGMTARLTRDVNTLASIRHQNIVKILGYVMENHRLCQIQELFLYGSLNQAMERITIPYTLKTRMAYEVADALCFLHERTPPIVHKRLKPSNVLVEQTFHVQISDILLERNDSWMMEAMQMRDISDRQRQARGDMSMYDCPGWVIAHVAPENIRNINCRPAPPYDVFSFGVLLWEMMADGKPYPGMKTDKVYEAVNQGRLLNAEGLRADRPQFLCDIMISTFTLQPEQRPLLPSLRNTILGHLDAHQCELDADNCKRQYEEWLRRKEEQREARRRAEQEGRDIAARLQRPAQQHLMYPAIPIRDEVAQRAIHAQVSGTIEYPPINRVMAPESEMFDDRRNHGPIAQPTPTILVNPEPVRQPPSNPTIYVDLNATRREASGPIAQPTPTILVNPDPVRPVEPAFLNRSPVAQPTPTISVNLRPNPQLPPGQSGEQSRPRQSCIAQPTPTVYVNLSEPTPDVVPNQPPEPQPADQPSEPEPTGQPSEPEPMVQTSESQPTSLQPSAPEPDQLSVSAPAEQPSQQEPSQVPEPSEQASQAAGSSGQPSQTQGQPKTGRRRNKPRMTREEIQAGAQLTIMYDPEEYRRQMASMALQREQQGNEIAEEQMQVDEGPNPDADCATPFADYPGLRNNSVPGGGPSLQQQHPDRVHINQADIVVVQPPPAERRMSENAQTPPTPPSLGRNEIPALNSLRAINRNDIDTVAVSIGNQWRRLARQMGLPDGTIDGINHDYDRDGLYEKAYQSILRWLTVQGNQVPVQNLAEVLYRMGAVTIVTKLLP